MWAVIDCGYRRTGCHCGLHVRRHARIGFITSRRCAKSIADRYGIGKRRDKRENAVLVIFYRPDYTGISASGKCHDAVVKISCRFAQICGDRRRQGIGNDVAEKNKRGAVFGAI